MNDVQETQPSDVLLANAEMQDHLMVACNDLERLQRLLSGACETLMASFDGANAALEQLREAAAHHDPASTVSQHLATAITALQFQDMASQLVNHTMQRLRNCADRLAADAWGVDDEEGLAIVETPPLRPNPVTQDEMDAGSIELF
ncbi:MAG: hypothetical protein IIZ92_08240 [Aquincola sp.]|uniref:hypothetical protein n=1 Tax=uncultured Aquincola sp. TaxID=886556 RepID=UPI0032B21028|nr:hypothetical protein [Aquincola sp.]|tara:strand:- start:3451 stop:3888 length:438 start_codon:yes stop_codon:yes gene_type:complete